jgi:pimeloyl-ACP methyl ester carboxylesterase
MLSHDDLGPGLPGTPVVLLHGFPLDRSVWAEAARELAKRRRVVAIDLLGFGGSAVSGPWTLEDQARAVRATTQSLKFGKFALAGLSMGGYVSLAYHRLFSVDLKALIIVDSKAAADTAEAKENRNRMAEVARREGSPAVAKLMFPKMLGPAAPEALRHRLMAIMNACPSETIAAACLAMRDRPECGPDVTNSMVPLQVIVGEHDGIIPPDSARALAASGNGQFDLIPDAGHMAPLERPREVAAAIDAFVSRLG